MSDLIAIHPGSIEWRAWLKHHRNTKTEARMLGCLGDAKSGLPPRSWFERSKFPPAAPSADGLTRRPAPAPEAAPWPADRPGMPDGEAGRVADRLEARAQRDTEEAQASDRRCKSQRKGDRLREHARVIVAANGRPDLSDTDDIGLLDVEDPAEAEELVRIGRGQPMRLRKKVQLRARVIALRDDPVGRMAKRGQLGNPQERELRLRAARCYETLYARAEIGGAKGLDPTKERVDGGVLVMPDTDARVAAQDRLAEIDKALGVDLVQVVRAVLIVKLQIKQVAQAFGRPTSSPTAMEKEEFYWGRRFQDGLDKIADKAGFTAPPARAASWRDRHSSLATHADNPELHRAVRQAGLIAKSPSNGAKVAAR